MILAAYLRSNRRPLLTTRLLGIGKPPCIASCGDESSSGLKQPFTGEIVAGSRHTNSQVARRYSASADKSPASTPGLNSNHR
jgi:hypothetical protein